MRFSILAALTLALALAVQAQTTAPDWQAKAIQKYPELGVQGSALNKRFVEVHAERRKTNPAFFKNPQWPLTLADELATAAQKPAQAAPPNPQPNQQPIVGKPTAAELEKAQADGKAVFLWADPSKRISLPASPPWRFPLSFVRLKPMKDYFIMTEFTFRGSGRMFTATMFVFSKDVPADADIRSNENGALSAGGDFNSGAELVGEGTLKVSVYSDPKPGDEQKTKSLISNVLELPATFGKSP